MKHIISYSGGLGSFMAAYLCQQQDKEFELVFCDTRSEDLDLYRFLNETKAYFNKEIIKLDYGADIWQLQHLVFFQANSQRDPCSRLTKRQKFRKYMRKNYLVKGVPQAVLVLGIDNSEASRTKEFERNHAPFEVYCPLMEANTTREDIEDVLDLIGIEPPRLYEKGFPHNNCGGFCVKSGQKQAALLLKSFPENYKWHEEKQELLFQLMEQKKPTIRKQVNGVMTYLSLKEFRELIEQGMQPDLFDEGNCACF